MRREYYLKSYFRNTATVAASKEMMMNSANRPVTVYFDTNFYVWLCRADETPDSELKKILDEMMRRLSAGRDRDWRNGGGEDAA